MLGRRRAHAEDDQADRPAGPPRRSFLSSGAVITKASDLPNVAALVYVAEFAPDAGEVKATHRDSRYQPIAEPEALGNCGRIHWVEGVPGEPPDIAGADFIIARNGRIAAVYLFFDKLPGAEFS